MRDVERGPSKNFLEYDRTSVVGVLQDMRGELEELWIFESVSVDDVIRELMSKEVNIKIQRDLYEMIAKYSKDIGKDVDDIRVDEQVFGWTNVVRSIYDRERLVKRQLVDQDWGVFEESDYYLTHSDMIVEFRRREGIVGVNVSRVDDDLGREESLALGIGSEMVSVVVNPQARNRTLVLENNQLMRNGLWARERRYRDDELAENLLVYSDDWGRRLSRFQAWTDLEKPGIVKVSMENLLEGFVELGAGYAESTSPLSWRAEDAWKFCRSENLVWEEMCPTKLVVVNCKPGSDGEVLTAMVDGQRREVEDDSLSGKLYWKASKLSYGLNVEDRLVLLVAPEESTEIARELVVIDRSGLLRPDVVRLV